MLGCVGRCRRGKGQTYSKFYSLAESAQDFALDVGEVLCFQVGGIQLEHPEADVNVIS